MIDCVISGVIIRVPIGLVFHHKNGRKAIFPEGVMVAVGTKIGHDFWFDLELVGIYSFHKSVCIKQCLCNILVIDDIYPRAGSFTVISNHIQVDVAKDVLVQSI